MNVKHNELCVNASCSSVTVLPGHKPHLSLLLHSNSTDSRRPSIVKSRDDCAHAGPGNVKST